MAVQIDRHVRKYINCDLLRIQVIDFLRFQHPATLIYLAESLRDIACSFHHGRSILRVL